MQSQGAPTAIIAIVCNGTTLKLKPPPHGGHIEEELSTFPTFNPIVRMHETNCYGRPNHLAGFRAPGTYNEERYGTRRGYRT